MPSKPGIFIGVIVLVFAFTVGDTLGIAGDLGPEIMVLKTPAAKKPARFPHKKHQGMFACKKCHHTKSKDGKKQPYEEDMQIRKCLTCHNSDVMKNPKLNSFKLAAHGLCKECHKEHKDSAPTKCTGCHIK